MGGSGDGDGEAVILRSQPWRFVFPRAVVPLLLITYSFVTFIDAPSEHLVLFAVMALTGLVLLATPVYLAVRARRQPWAIRIDRDGVTWHDSGFQLSWSIARVTPVLAADVDRRTGLVSALYVW